MLPFAPVKNAPLPLKKISSAFTVTEEAVIASLIVSPPVALVAVNTTKFPAALNGFATVILPAVNDTV